MMSQQCVIRRRGLLRRTLLIWPVGPVIKSREWRESRHRGLHTSQRGLRTPQRGLHTHYRGLFTPPRGLHTPLRRLHTLQRTTHTTKRITHTAKRTEHTTERTTHTKDTHLRGYTRAEDQYSVNMAQSPAAVLFLLISLCLHTATGAFPRAQNVTWKSTNFKTVLSWEPQPSEEFSYTVEYSVLGGDKQRIYNCIRSSLTMCDLSSSLTDVNACYTADVLTEPPRGAVSELTEAPHTSSPPFCPFKDTEIGRPDFKLQVSEDQGTTTLFISDPLTALFSDGRQLSIRDVFSEKLQYRVTYRRNKSTGKKVLTSQSNEIQVSGLDRGESYCFSVQAFIPSRASQQLGDMSETKCSDQDNPSIFKVYSVGVIACAIFLILLLIGIVIAVVVVCCKRRKNSAKSGKEGVPLQNV